GRGFNKYKRIIKRGNQFKEISKTIFRYRERTLFNNFFSFINDTEIKGVFRHINANVVHDNTSLVEFLKSLITILPTGRGLIAQSSNWVLRDRGTYSLRGFRAYEKWSLCPSLYFKNLFYLKI
ncbi:hypothetical protein HG1285_12487, partial [Hydrogenivirga sp. 128-5-R1-1]